MKNVRFVGLDVHAETIAVAVAEVGGEVRSLGVIPNRAEAVGRLMRKLGSESKLARRSLTTLHKSAPRCARYPLPYPSAPKPNCSASRARRLPQLTG
jgi:hypothetical protein